MLSNQDHSLDESIPKPDWLALRKRLLPRTKLEPSVALLDLTRLRLKLRDESEGEGWPVAVCALAESEYRRFLTLKRLMYSTTIVPNHLIDKFWHAHILDTRNYEADCLRLFGEFLHHYPYFGKRGVLDQQELVRAFERTKVIYQKIFDESMDASPAQAAKILAEHGLVSRVILSDASLLKD